MVERGQTVRGHNLDSTDDSNDITTSWSGWYRIQQQGVRGQRVEKFRRDCTDQHGNRVEKNINFQPSLQELGVEMWELAPYLPKPVVGGTKTLVFCEGESDSDTVNALLTDDTIRVAGLQSANWAPNKDWILKSTATIEKIILWPDHDKVGVDAMRKVSNLFIELAPQIKQGWVVLPEDSPKGWGAADVASQVNDLVTEAIENATETQRINVDTILEEEYRERDPDPIPGESFIGPLGRIVKAWSPHTEADDAVLMTTLVNAVGALVGVNPFIPHPIKGFPQTFNIIVGRPHSGKGTAWDLVREEFLKPLLALLHEEYRYYNMVTTSINSGEGIIHRYAQEDAEPVQLWVLEEAKQFFVAMARQDSTVDVVTRQLFDRVPLAINTKNPLRADNAAGSMLMHVTPAELLKMSHSLHAGGGIFRRISFQKSLKKEGIRSTLISPREIDLQLQDVADCIRAARVTQRLWFTPEGEEKWNAIREEFTTERETFMSNATASAPTRIARWAVVFALMDRRNHPSIIEETLSISEPSEFRGMVPQADIIGPQHLQSAVDFEKRSQQTLIGIFGDKEFSTEARTLLDALENAKDGELTQSDISRGVFARNKNSDELFPVFRELIEAGRVRPQKGISPKTGKVVKIWRLIQKP